MVVGHLVLEVGVLIALLGSASGLAQELIIFRPAAGTVFEPGESIFVEVTVGEGSAFGGPVYVGGTLPLGIVGPSAAAPYEFEMTIPADTITGRYLLTAFGLSAGQLIYSRSVLIGIERAVVPSELRVEPDRLEFDKVGEKIPLQVFGVYPDGSVGNVTESLRLTYESADRETASVSEVGVVIGSGAGSTSVVVLYDGGPSVSVPVFVPNEPVPGDLDGNGVVDCADVAIVKASYGRRSGQPGFDLRADVVVDAVVNIRDLAFVSQRLPVGTSCP